MISADDLIPSASPKHALTCYGQPGTSVSAGYSVTGERLLFYPDTELTETAVHEGCGGCVVTMVTSKSVLLRHWDAIGGQERHHFSNFFMSGPQCTCPGKGSV